MGSTVDKIINRNICKG